MNTVHGSSPQVTSAQRAGPPSWWSHKGEKVELLIDPKYTRPSGAAFMIGSPDSEVSRLWILYGPVGLKGERTWVLHWRLRHGGLDKSSGAREVSDHTLTQMFSVNPGDAGLEGMYIRLGQYLNVPHRGLRLDMDPNMSILVSQEMVDAIHRMLTVGYA